MRIATLVVVALMATVVAVSAQTPYIAVYFDQYLTQETKDCPGPMAGYVVRRCQELQRVFDRR